MKEEEYGPQDASDILASRIPRLTEQFLTETVSDSWLISSLPPEILASLWKFKIYAPALREIFLNYSRGEIAPRVAYGIYNGSAGARVSSGGVRNSSTQGRTPTAHACPETEASS